MSDSFIVDRYYEALKAMRRFEKLVEAVHPSHSDDVIIRCEVTVGDIRALIKCLKTKPAAGEAAVSARADDSSAKGGSCGERGDDVE